MAIKTYRVRSGCTFGPLGEFKPGDLVKLEETQAAGFLDKLRLIDSEDSQVPALKNELGAVIPEDLKLIPQDDEDQEAESQPIKLQDESPLDATEESKEDKPRRGRKPKGK